MIGIESAPLWGGGHAPAPERCGRADGIGSLSLCQPFRLTDPEGAEPLPRPWWGLVCSDALCCVRERSPGSTRTSTPPRASRAWAESAAAPAGGFERTVPPPTRPPARRSTPGTTTFPFPPAHQTSSGLPRCPVTPGPGPVQKHAVPPRTAPPLLSPLRGSACGRAVSEGSREAGSPSAARSRARSVVRFGGGCCCGWNCPGERGPEAQGRPLVPAPRCGPLPLPHAPVLGGSLTAAARGREHVGSKYPLASPTPDGVMIALDPTTLAALQAQSPAAVRACARRAACPRSRSFQPGLLPGCSPRGCCSACSDFTWRRAATGPAPPHVQPTPYASRPSLLSCARH